MATVRQFFESCRGTPTAAYLKFGGRGAANTLYYHSSASPIPPTVYVDEAMAAIGVDLKGSILVNSSSNWINTYRTVEEPYDRSNVASYQATPVKITADMTRWDQFSLDKLGAKPNLGSIYNETTNDADSRARQIYLLSAFCVLYYKGALKGYKSGGHNIGSVLVSDTGEVLSWGVNDGSYRHAEVNTLINYFLKNPTATSLPKRSVLFTTLKPCMMCSTYIKESWDTPGETRVYYGMFDSGSSGSTPLLGSKASELEGGAPLTECIYPQPDPDAYLGFGENMKIGTAPVGVTQGSSRVGLTKSLNDSSASKPAKMMVADWVDSSAAVKNLFEAAFREFASGASKIGPATKADAPVRNVLIYLKGWLS